MCDHGYALTTEPNALKAMIPPPSLMGKVASSITGSGGGHADVLPDGFISSMPWRKAGVRYTQNEIYFDIEEVRGMMRGVMRAAGRAAAARRRRSRFPPLLLTSITSLPACLLACLLVL